MTENPELFLKIAGTVAGAIFAYHKYITTQLDKKVDKEDCQTTHKYTQQLKEESTKTLFKNIGEIKDKPKIIEEHLLSHK